MNTTAAPSPLILDSTMTGEHFLFLESSRSKGGLFRFVYTLAVGSAGPGPHYHEGETEVFRMVSGVLTFWLDGVKREYGPGEEIVVPAGTHHGFKNLGTVPVVCEVTFDGSRMEDTFVSLASEIRRRGLVGLPMSMTFPMWVTLVANRASSHSVGLVRWITYAGGAFLMRLGKRPLPPEIGWPEARHLAPSAGASAAA